MKRSEFAAVGLVALGLAACAVRSRQDLMITDLAAADLSAEVRALAESAEAGFTVTQAQRKVREGRTYFDVEGRLPDGREIEFDILMAPDGPTIVEVQRDLAWLDVPGAVRVAALAAAPGFTPVRVIESRQTDGTVIYELFAPGAPADPAMEVSLAGGAATVLSERWQH